MIKRFVLIDNLRCPRCGHAPSWSCMPEAGSKGWAHCQNGGYVSRRFTTGPVCGWAGTRITRTEKNVVAPLPLSLKTVST